MNVQELREKVTAEQVMLAVLLVLSGVFFVEPIVQEYPDDARVFPQMTSAAVFIGCFLLLVQNYLPGPVRKFVAESVSITSTPMEEEEDEEDEDDEEFVKETLGRDYGYEVNDTVFMVGTSTLYLVLGWAVGLLFVTFPFVLAYMLWFKVRWPIAVVCGVAATAIIYLFRVFLLLRLDRGAILDFSPFVPTSIDLPLAFALATVAGVA
ncbi:hypothetical protein [Natronorarus salvus]|uniref:hypothetical protein n=1 Tax=Natronorarus salvus TaxID=3117733 RepID=UPI002F266283